MMPDQPWRMLMRWVQSWNQPRTRDLPPPVVPIPDAERRAREDRLARATTANRAYDAEVNERVTRLEALGETLRGVARVHGDTDHYPTVAQRE